MARPEGVERMNDPDDCPPPHCDQTILHAPGTCEVCDRYPDWQKLRAYWQINFTGEYDTDKAPCPSVYFREVGVRDRWPGNRPWKEEP